MRMIDADAFREWWLENGENEYVYDTNAVLDSIDDWPTLTPQNEWVSVEDRLPETDGVNTHKYDVLVYIPKRDGCHQHGIYTGKLCYIPADDGSGNFWNFRRESSEWTVRGWSYFENPIVTHWMPLPAPPDRRPPEGEKNA